MVDAVMSLSNAEKQKFLRALEEDLEFRYAVMGLLGFKEILDRIVRLEERFAKLEERQQILEERFAGLEERYSKLEERFARLEERQQILEERFARLEEEFRENRRLVLIVAHRFGVISERAFREAMRFVVEEVLGVAKVEKWVYRDGEGYVYGYPSIIEVDVVVRDDVHVLVEVKSRVSRGDVAELYRKAVLYERIVGVKPKMLIIGGFIDEDAWEAARKLDVEIRPIIAGESQSF